MQPSQVHSLVDQLCQADSPEKKSAQATALKLAIDGMRRSITSLEDQLKDFYAAQVEHQGATLDDYKRMIVSLDEQVRSYVDEQIA